MMNGTMYMRVMLRACMQIYPPAWYELGVTYRNLGDCEVANNSVEVAIEWKEKAYTCLTTVMGDAPEALRAKGAWLALTAGGSRTQLEEASRLLKAV